MRATIALAAAALISACGKEDTARTVTLKVWCGECIVQHAAGGPVTGHGERGMWTEAFAAQRGEEVFLSAKNVAHHSDTAACWIYIEVDGEILQSAWAPDSGQVASASLFVP